MQNWIEDLLSIENSGQHSENEHSAFSKIQAAGQALGFEYCAFGLQISWPLNSPRVFAICNFPAAWKARYIEAGYLDSDPTIEHARRTRTPLVWTDDVFLNTPVLWAELQSAGLRVGWSQSCFDGCGTGSMLTLARAKDVLTESELAKKESKMTWLMHVAHATLSRTLIPYTELNTPVRLTPREIEVLKWHADGKTGEQIAHILHIGIDTVKFHTKNATMKLGATNKTSAAVRAALLGLLI